MQDWTEGRRYGPKFASMSRADVLARANVRGEDGPLWLVLGALQIPGASAARRINAAKDAIISGDDPPEDIVSAVLKALQDNEKSDIGQGQWLGRGSEMLQSVDDYLQDLKRHYRDLESAKDKIEKKD